MQVGLEFNAQVAEVNPLATLFVVHEAGRRPALFLGTSSDRIGSPEGKQAYYATLSKSLPAARLSANVTLNYSEWDDAINVPFGAAVDLGRSFTVRYMYDGHRSHALLDHYVGDRFGISVLAIWLERFGVAVHGGF
jgi:hypothetical protein